MTLSQITVSDNRRFLQTTAGAPFFWLGDTAWELFHRLTREEAELFLEKRKQQGFNVIQAVVLAEFDGIRTPNAYGDHALIDADPTQPNEAYFHLVDEYIDLAATKGLYIGLLPTWGDKMTDLWGAGPVIFTEENARIYGQRLGERYRNRSNVIWILGGDRPALTDTGKDYRPLWRAMAAGIDEGTEDHPFKSYHPAGGRSTSIELHNEAWLDMNMIQSGHGSGRSTPVWEMIAHDYGLTPVKPTLDAEPNYEDHPVNPWPEWTPANGYFRDDDVRRQSYRAVFAGGCGITYGHHAVWQFCSPRNAPINYADRSWQAAIDRPGANQMIHLRRLMESLPYFTRVPDQSLLLDNPDERGSHMVATRDADGRYALAYTPLVQPMRVRLDWAAAAVNAFWYNPRTGQTTAIGAFAPQAAATFEPPVDGPDWVLLMVNGERLIDNG